MAMYRVRMDASDGDYLLLLVPLDGDGELDISASDPIGLFKGTWTNGARTIYCGEVKVAPSGVVLEWFGEYPETTAIDLEEQNVHVGAVFRVDATDGSYGYTVRSVAPA